MKWKLLFLLAFTTLQAAAQQATNLYKWAKIAPAEMPVKSQQPDYNLTVLLDESTFTKEKLYSNAEYYYEKLFSTSLTKKEGNNKISGVGTYTFGLSNNNDDQGDYTANYVLDVVVKNGRYTMQMHSFTVTHEGVEINVVNRIDAAAKNDRTAKRLLDSFHRKNKDELKKLYDTMELETLP